MIIDKHLLTFREKISELNTALFVSQSDAVLKVPTSIVSILNVDDVGQLWFFIPKPTQSISEFEKTFVAKLDFFKKGKNFFIEILGVAHIVSDPEEINCLVDVADEVKQKAFHDSVLVKVRLLNVRYFASRKNVQASPGKKMRETIYKMLFNDRQDYRPYHVIANGYAY